MIPWGWQPGDDLRSGPVDIPGQIRLPTRTEQERNNAVPLLDSTGCSAQEELRHPRVSDYAWTDVRSTRSARVAQLRALARAPVDPSSPTLVKRIQPRVMRQQPPADLRRNTRARK
jgi:hypothetical protein